MAVGSSFGGGGSVHVEEVEEMLDSPNTMIGRRMQVSRGSQVLPTPWFTLLPLLVLQGQAVHTGWPGGGGGQHGHTPKVRRLPCMYSVSYILYSVLFWFLYPGQTQLSTALWRTPSPSSSPSSSPLSSSSSSPGEHRLCARPLGGHYHPVQWQPQSGRQL